VHVVEVPFGPAEIVKVHLTLRSEWKWLPYLEEDEAPGWWGEGQPLLVPYQGVTLDLGAARRWTGGPEEATVRLECGFLPHLPILRPEGWRRHVGGAAFAGGLERVEVWVPAFETESLVPWRTAPLRRWLAAQGEMPPEALILMAASIEARSGRSFEDDPRLRAAFEQRPWYLPDPDWGPQLLSREAREAIDLLRWRAASGGEKPSVEPRPPEPSEAVSGEAEPAEPAPLRPLLLDLDRLPSTLSDAEEQVAVLLERGGGVREIRLLRNAYFARHGYTFRTGWLREYFEGIPGYSPRADFSPELLEEEERKIVARLREMEVEYRSARRPQPAIPDGMPTGFLDDSSEVPRTRAEAEAWVARARRRSPEVREVRALRNAIFALHGRPFRDSWLRDFFRSKGWYREDPSFEISRLTRGEWEAVQVLAAFQAELQER
jgi:hypothetical protein